MNDNNLTQVMLYKLSIRLIFAAGEVTCIFIIIVLMEKGRIVLYRYFL